MWLQLFLWKATDEMEIFMIKLLVASKLKDKVKEKEMAERFTTVATKPLNLPSI